MCGISWRCFSGSCGPYPQLSQNHGYLRCGLNLCKDEPAGRGGVTIQPASRRNATISSILIIVLTASVPAASCQLVSGQEASQQPATCETRILRRDRMEQSRDLLPYVSLGTCQVLPVFYPSPHPSPRLSRHKRPGGWHLERLRRRLAQRHGQIPERISAVACALGVVDRIARVLPTIVHAIAVAP